MNIEQELERARAAARRKDGYPARAILRKVIEQEPHNVEAWLLFADVAQRPEHAVQCLERVLHIDPENDTARQKMGEVFTPRRARRPAPTGPLQSTMPALDDPPPNLGPSFQELGAASRSPYYPYDWPLDLQGTSDTSTSSPIALDSLRSAFEYEDDGSIGDGDQAGFASPTETAPNGAHSSPASKSNILIGETDSGEDPAGDAFSDGVLSNNGFLPHAAAQTPARSPANRLNRKPASMSSRLELALMIVAAIMFLCVLAGLVFYGLGGASLLGFS